VQTRYPSSIREEELKNKVAADFFGVFDCTRIIGNVDFCVAAKAGGPRPVAAMDAADAPERVPPSEAACAVLDAGRELWRYYHAQPGANSNASYYDIRLHFQGVKRTASGKEQMNATSSDAKYNELLAALRSAHKALAAQIAPKMYEYGFLKR